MAKSNKQYTPTPLDAELQKAKAEDAPVRALASASELPFIEESKSSPFEKKAPPRAKSKYASSTDKEPAPFYLQLHIDNLARYLSIGLFYPVAWEQELVYKENREARIDILTSFPNHLVFSHGVFVAFKEREVLLELVLTPQEQKLVQSIGNYHFYNNVLPISRIKQVIFPSNNARQNYLASREIFEDFFFPELLIAEKPSTLAKISISEANPTSSDDNYLAFVHKSALFDRALGFFAFLKNVPLLRADYTGTVIDWDDRFMSALSLVNQAVMPRQITGTSLFRPMLNIESYPPAATSSERRSLLLDIIFYIYLGESFSYSWAVDALNKYEELKGFATLFHDLQQEGRTNFRSVINTLRADATRPENNLPLILLVLLCKFSNKQRSHTDKQSVRIYFQQDKYASEYEISICAAALGLYYGYQNMIREDQNIRLADKGFSSLVPYINRIKFQVDRFLDRLVVESVFLFFYNGYQTSDEFTYLRYKYARSVYSPSLPSGYTSKPTVVLGVSIPNATASKWNSYVSTLPQSIPFSHPAVQLLALYNLALPKDIITRLLEELPSEQQESVLSFLNSVKVPLSK